MRQFLFLAILFLCVQLSFAQTKPISGFTTSSANAQSQLEAKFDAGLSRESIGQNIKHLSAKPHAVGSPAGKEYADYILNFMQT